MEKNNKCRIKRDSSKALDLLDDKFKNFFTPSCSMQGFENGKTKKSKRSKSEDFSYRSSCYTEKNNSKSRKCNLEGNCTLFSLLEAFQNDFIPEWFRLCVKNHLYLKFNDHQPLSLRTVWQSLTESFPNKFIKITDEEKFFKKITSPFRVGSIIFTPSTKNSRVGHYVYFPPKEGDEFVTIEFSKSLWCLKIITCIANNCDIKVPCNKDQEPIFYSFSKGICPVGAEYEYLGDLAALLNSPFEFADQMLKANGHSFNYFSMKTNAVTMIVGAVDVCQSFNQGGFIDAGLTLAQNVGNYFVSGAIAGFAFGALVATSPIAASLAFVAAGYISGILFDMAFDAVKDWITSETGAGLNVEGDSGGGPGGVDIDRVPELKDFHNEPMINISKQLSVFFPLEVDWSQIKTILKIDSPAEIPNLVLHEMVRLLSFERAPVMVSLHFGKEGYLYSVMHPAVRQTLTGHIIGYIDYYLKSFLNGGTFTEEFLREYENKKHDRNSLEKAVIDIRLELKRMKQKPEVNPANLPERYQTLYDLLADENAQTDLNKKYHSAFRIIGDIDSVSFDDQGIIEPLSSFFVEYDLNILPDCASELSGAISQGLGFPKTHIDIVNAFEKMKFNIKKDMPNIPRFAPYFEVLKIISFSAAFAKTLLKAGKIPQIQGISAEGLGLPPFPSILPPIPIRKMHSVALNLNFLKLCEFAHTNKMLNNETAIINSIVSSLLDGKKESLDEKDNLIASVTKICQAFVRQNLEAKLKSLNLQVHDFDDSELQITKLIFFFLKEGLNTLRYMVSIPIYELVNNMKNLIGPNQEFETAFEIICVAESLNASLEILKNTVIPVWKKNWGQRRIKLLENAFANLKNALKMPNLVFHFNEFDIERLLTNIKQNFDNEIQKNIYTVAPQKLQADIESRNKQGGLYLSEIKNLFVIEKRVNSKIETIFKDTNINKNDSIANLVRLEKLGLNKEALNKFIIEKVNLPYVGIPGANENFLLGVQGGCCLKKSIAFPLKNSEITNKYLDFITSSNGFVGQNKDKKSFLHWKLQLSPNVYNDSLLRLRYSSTRPQTRVAINFRNQIFFKLLDMSVADKRDEDGNNLLHCLSVSKENSSLELLKNFNLKDFQRLNVKRADGFGPIDLACASGNLETVKLLISKGASLNHVFPNGLSPLLISAQLGHESICITILKTRNFGAVNHSTDTLMTPLHWATLHNQPKLIAELLSCGATLLPRRSDSKTPLHLAFLKGYSVCSELLLKRYPSERAKTTVEDRNIAHFAVISNSMSCLKLIFQDQASCQLLLQKKDKFQLKPLDLALFLGYENIALLLITKGKFAVDKASVNNPIYSTSPWIALSLGVDIDYSKELYNNDKIHGDLGVPDDPMRNLIALIQDRNLKDFLSIIRSAVLNENSKQIVLSTIVQEGLHTWITPLRESGFEILDKINMENDTILDIAARKNDELMIWTIWKEIGLSSIDPVNLLELINHAIISSIPKPAINILARFQKFTMRKIKNKVLSSGDYLLNTLHTTPIVIGLAKELSINLSETAFFIAAERARPSVLQSLLAEPSGLLVNVREKMIGIALNSNRLDNALMVYRAMKKVPSEQENLKNTYPSLELLNKEFEYFEQQKVNMKTRDKLDFTSLKKDHKRLNDLIKKLGFLPFLNENMIGYMLFCDLLSESKFLHGLDFSINLDNGGRLIDFLFLITTNSENSDYIKKFFDLNLIKPRNIVTNSFVSVKSDNESVISLFKYLLRKYNNAEDLFFILKFLCLGCECNDKDWVEIIEIDEVKKNLAQICEVRDPEDGKTVTMMASTKPSHFKLMDTILKLPQAKKLIEIRDYESKSACHYCLEYLINSDSTKAPGIDNALSSVATNLLKKLLSVAPSLILAADRENVSLFMLAAKNNLVPCVSYLASRYPAEILNQNFSYLGERAIHLAAKNDSVKVIRYLVLNLGISPNTPTEAVEKIENDLACENKGKNSFLAGNTPLHLAAQHDKKAAFKCLLDLGADPLRKNNLGVTPIHVAVEFGSQSLWEDVLKELPAMWLLIWSGELLNNVCRNKKIDTNILLYFLQYIHPNKAVSNSKLGTTQNSSPLLESVSAENLKTCTILLEFGADLSFCDDNRCNPFHLAAKSKNAGMMLTLLQFAHLNLHESEIIKILTKRDFAGDTPLHEAVRNNAEAVILILLGLKYVIPKLLTITNNEGLSPSNLAALSNNREISVLLFRAQMLNNIPTENVSINSVDADWLKNYWKNITEDEKYTADKKLSSLNYDEKPLMKEKLSSELQEFLKFRINGNNEEDPKIFENFKILLLQQKDGAALIEAFDSHPSFALKIGVKKRIASVCCEKKYSASVYDLLRLGLSESNVPEFLLTIFVEFLIVWSPPEDWLETIKLVKRVRDALKNRLAENHVFCEWLRILLLPRKLCILRPNTLYQKLGLFVESVSAFLDDLPPADLVQDFSENATSIQSLENILTVLQSSVKTSFHGFQIQRLNKIRPFADIVLAETEIKLSIPDDRLIRFSLVESAAKKAQIPKAHWQILEAHLIFKLGYESIQFLDDLRQIYYLTPVDRNFIIGTVLELLTRSKIPPKGLRSWAAVASNFISEFGFSNSEIIKNIIFNFNKLKNHVCLEMFIRIFAAVSESNSLEEIISYCFEAEKSKNNLEEFLKGLDSLVKNLRKLAPDRDIDEIINCFSSSNKPKAIKPHEFSFDGTPLVRLPAIQIEQLKNIITLVEKYDKELGDPTTLREQCKVLAKKFYEKPTKDTLARLLACVREGFFKVIEKKPFKIQTICVAAFFLPVLEENQQEFVNKKGRLGQVATGEGKSIIVAMTAVVFALQGRFVDIITSSQSLARRDAEEFKEIFNYFDISVGSVAVHSPTKDDFNALVLYGTNTDFEFAQLREGVYLDRIRMIDQNKNNTWRFRYPDTVIVDESDNLFLDAAQNSARIGFSTGQSYTWIYPLIMNYVKENVVAAVFLNKDKTAIIDKMEKFLIGKTKDKFLKKQLQNCTHDHFEKWIDAALDALNTKIKDKHYIIRQGEIIIVDMDTGRLQEGCRWSNGVHEMVEVKENIPVNVESGTIASVSHPSFFEFYQTIIGITGTAGEIEEREEIEKVYGIDTFDVPPHRICLRKRMPTRIYKTKEQKLLAMLTSIKQIYPTRSVLVLFKDILSTIEFSSLLRRENINHLVLNEKQKESEDLIIFKAGQIRNVTVATNTAGRGTDIKLTKELLESGGLHVIFGNFPSNFRVECQGLGRSGRQGQPGTNQIFVSVDEKEVNQFLRNSIDAKTSFKADGSLESKLEESDLIEKLYLERTKSIIQISNRRCLITALERARFAALLHFFEDREWLAKSALNPNEASYKTSFAKYGGDNNFSIAQTTKRLLLRFKVIWTIFFSNLSNQNDIYSTYELSQLYLYSRPNKNLINKKGEEIYEDFLKKNNWTLTKFKGAEIKESHYSAIFENHYSLAVHLELTQSKIREERDEPQRDAGNFESRIRVQNVEEFKESSIFESALRGSRENPHRIDQFNPYGSVFEENNVLENNKDFNRSWLRKKESREEASNKDQIDIKKQADLKENSKTVDSEINDLKMEEIPAQNSPKNMPLSKKNLELPKFQTKEERDFYEKVKRFAEVFNLEEDVAKDIVSSYANLSVEDMENEYLNIL